MNLNATLQLRIFGLLKIPMILFASPTVMEVNDQRCVIKIPLNRRTKNHLGSMYFGVLAVGADCAGGLIAWKLIKEGGNLVQLVFKDFHADFIKRPEGDVFFTCDQGREIQELMSRTLESNERQNLPVRVTATVPSQSGDDPVAEFKLTLSLKKK